MMKLLKKRGLGLTSTLGVLIMLSGLFIFNKCFSSQHEEVTTKSGLKVLFLEDKNLPYIQFSLWFLNAGSNYDYKNKYGLSTLTVSLLEQGAGGLSSEEIQENIDYYGAHFRSMATRQFSTLTLDGLSWQAKDLWSIFLKIASEPHLEEKEFKLLKQQFLESRYQELDDPNSIASEVWRQGFFQEGTASGQQVSGTIISLNQINLEDVKQLFSDYYLKGQPILTVVGQFDEALKQEIITSFSARFSKEEEKPSPQASFKKSSSFKLLKKNNQVQSQIIIGFKTLAFPKDKPRIFVALDLANNIFGGAGDLNNRLMSKLREEMGLTYGVWSQLSLGWSYGFFKISAATKTKSTGLFLKEALNLLKDFQEKGITEEELKTAKLVLKSYNFKSTETRESQLYRIVYYNYYLKTPASFVDDYLSIIEDISVEEVNKAIKEYLIPSDLHVLVYGDPSVKEQFLEIKGLNPLEEISFEDYFSKELK